MGQINISYRSSILVLMITEEMSINKTTSTGKSVHGVKDPLQVYILKQIIQVNSMVVSLGGLSVAGSFDKRNRAKPGPILSL